MEEFYQSKFSYEPSYIESFFTICTRSKGGLLLLANGKMLYIRNEETGKWQQNFEFEAPILSIFPLSSSTGFKVITETTIDNLRVKEDGDKTEIVRD